MINEGGWEEENKEEYRKEFRLEKLEELAFGSSHRSVRKEAMEAIQSLLSDDPSIMPMFIERNGVERLLEEVEKEREVEEGGEEEEREVRACALDLLISFTQKDQTREMMMERGLLDQFIVDSASPNPLVQSISLKLLALLAVNGLFPSSFITIYLLLLLLFYY